MLKYAFVKNSSNLKSHKNCSNKFTIKNMLIVMYNKEHTVDVVMVK